MALIVSGRTISNKKKQAVPAFEWRTTQWIFRIQIFGAVAFRSPPKSLARSHAAQHWKLTALPRFPAADKIKAQGSAGSIQHPVSGRGGNAGWYRKHHSEPDDELWRTHSCCGRKGAGKREERCAEHDQCHCEPRQSGDRRPCRNHCSREVK